MTLRAERKLGGEKPWPRTRLRSVFIVIGRPLRAAVRVLFREPRASAIGRDEPSPQRNALSSSELAPFAFATDPLFCSLSDHFRGL